MTAVLSSIFGMLFLLVGIVACVLFLVVAVWVVVALVKEVRT